MIRPNFIGPKALYLNPSYVQFSSAELALVDSVLTSHVIQPYAYTATVNDNYDAVNIGFDDSTTGSDIVAYRRVAFGLFLSPENEKKNLIFQVSGQASISLEDAGYMYGNFFFGRKATDNTVVSSKAAASNDLAKWMVLPNATHAATSNFGMAHSIETDVFSLELSGGYVYCFGYMISNPGAGNITMHGTISLAVRKYNTELGVFRPSR